MGFIERSGILCHYKGIYGILEQIIFESSYITSGINASVLLEKTINCIPEMPGRWTAIDTTISLIAVFNWIIS